MESEPVLRGTSAREADRTAAAVGAGRSRDVALLRIGALVGAVLWLVAVVTAFWAAWDPFTSADSFELVRDNRLAFSLATALSNTWGYLLVAVVAYAASGVLDRARGDVGEPRGRAERR